jgi:small nuclear ribonucleoprotein D3
VVLSSRVILPSRDSHRQHVLAAECFCLLAGKTRFEGKMSIVGATGKVGIPTVLLQESEALLITVELKSGDTARGWLLKAEDSWNLQMKDVTLTNAEDGTERQLKSLYIRGDRVRFIVLPDILEESVIFDRVQLYKATKGREGGGPKGLGRGAKFHEESRRQQQQSNSFGRAY